MPPTYPSWNSADWQRKFSEAVQTSNSADLHTLRIAVYENTCSCVQAGGYITEDGAQVSLPLTEDIGAQSCFYNAEFHPQPVCRFKQTLIRAVREDCLLTAKRIRELGEEVCVLNMANRQTPGGGVLQGCGAQEEALFRRSDYFRSLYRYSNRLAHEYGIDTAEEHYPMHCDFGGVFTRGVTIFRGSERTGYPLLRKSWKANFIAVAAVNRPDTETDNGEARLTPPMIQATKNKIRTILRIAVDNAQENLVLGALGCGAFHNPPAHMAELFAEVLGEEEFNGAFKRIFFSIIEDHNSREGGNFLPFARVFNSPSADTISQLAPHEVFVFGSNLAGHHAGGAAHAAMKHFGAVWGQGTGLQGQSYAIPTMQGGVETIAPYVLEFTEFAEKHPELTFLVTRIGCGIAGFRDEEIAPLFTRAAALPNVHLPLSFQGYADSSIFTHREGLTSARQGRKSSRSWCLQANDYLLGINGKTFDIKEALILLEYGIQQGEADCYLELASLYNDGRYLPYNPIKAKAYMLEAVSMGSVAALAELGNNNWDAQGAAIDNETFGRRLPYLISQLSQPNAIDDDDIRLYYLAELMVTPMALSGRFSGRFSEEAFQQADMIAEKINDQELRDFVIRINHHLQTLCKYFADDEHVTSTEQRETLRCTMEEMKAIANSPTLFAGIFANMLLYLYEDESSPFYDEDMAYAYAVSGAQAGNLDCTIIAALMESRRKQLSDEEVNGLLASIHNTAQFGCFGAPDDDDLEGVLVYLTPPQVGVLHAIIPTEELNRMSGEDICQQLYSIVSPDINIRNTSEKTYTNLSLSLHCEEGDLACSIPELPGQHDCTLSPGYGELVKHWPKELPTGTLTLSCEGLHRFCNVSSKYRSLTSPSNLPPLRLSWEVGFGFGQSGKKIRITNLSQEALRVNLRHQTSNATATVDIMPSSDAEISVSNFSEPIELLHDDSLVIDIEGYDTMLAYIYKTTAAATHSS